MPPLPITLVGAGEIKDRQRRRRTEEINSPTPDDEPPACSEDTSCTSPITVGEEARDNSTGAGQHQYTTRHKKAAPLREALASAAEAAEARGVRVELPAFATLTNREYDTQEALLDDFKEYCATYNVAYRVRQSTSQEARNKFLQGRVVNPEETSGTPTNGLDASPMVPPVATPLNAMSENPPDTTQLDISAETSHVLVPPSISHFLRQFQCVHAGKQKARTTGKRFHALTRFTNCTARMTARAVYNPASKTWRVVVENENTTHNHVCNESVFYSYLNNSQIDEDALFKEAASAIASEGNARIIRDNITARSGAPFTQSQYSNLKHYQLGTLLAGENLEDLIKKFGELSGNWCTVLREEGTDMVRGIVFQTALQRTQFQRFGGSLVLDWTHQTNNLGFHLGSLLATSVTGKGLPILDFLCLSQGAVTMTSVLEAFVAHNPGAVAKVKSFVIDKDLAEWAAIRAVFPASAVVLCQFHVVKWFKGCMTNPDYHIEPADQKPTLKILRAMVYATSAAAFKGLKGQLRRRLNKERHAPFHAYMKRRWYSMTEQWSDYKRGKVFTAGNTTSNRLEAHWKHLKAGMGKKRRIDACFQAIVRRGRSVLSRERDELVKYQGTTRILEGVHKFVHPLLRELSTSRVILVRKQWEKYAAHPSWFHARRVEDSTEGVAVYNVSVKPQSRVEHTVSCSAAAEWSCSCRFAVTHGLPCRHQLYVGQKHENLVAFPVSALASRWRMSVATTLIDQLNTVIKELATIRVHVPGFTFPECRPNATANTASEDRPTPQSSRPQTVTHVRVRSYERTDALVVDALHKRNHVRGQLAQVVLPMMELSSPRFRYFSEKLEDVLRAFVDTLTLAPQSQSNVADESKQVDDAIPVNNSAQVNSDVDVDAGLDIEVLQGLLNEEDATEPTDGENGAPQYEPGEVHEDEDEQADEEDFLDDEDALLAMMPTDAGLDLGSFFDKTELDALMLNLSPRFPSLSDAETASRLEALLLDSDGDDHFCVKPIVGDAYVRAVATAIEAASHGSLDSLAIESPKSRDHDQLRVLPPRPGLNEIVALNAKKSADIMHVAQAKRKIGEDSPTEPVKKARGDHGERGLLISKYLPSATRGAPRQKAQLGPSGERIAAIVTRSECPLMVTDFVTVLQFSPLAEFDGLVQLYPVLYTDVLFNARAVRVNRAQGSVPILNFFVPLLLEDKIRAAVNEAKSSAGAPLLAEASAGLGSKGKAGSSAEVPLIVDATLSTSNHDKRARPKEQFCAKVQGMAQDINEDGLLALAAARSLKTLYADYKDDCDWILNDSSWKKTRVADPLPFLSHCAVECGGGPLTQDPLGVTGMRKSIMATLEAYSLRTQLSVPVFTPLAGDVPARRSPSVPLAEVVGRLRDKEWLNDTVVNFVLHLLASKYTDVSVIDSLMVEKPVTPPAAFLTLQRLIVFPINFDEEHWCVICVEFDWAKSRAAAYAYDPLGKAKYDKRLERLWSTWCHPLLGAWLQRDQRRVLSATDSATAYSSAQLPPVTLHFAVVGTPKQDDGYSCGVYCVALAHSYMSETFGMHDLHTFTEPRLQVMRLRLLYVILKKAVTRIDGEDAARASEMKSQLRRYAKQVDGGLSKARARKSRSKKRVT